MWLNQLVYLLLTFGYSKHLSQLWVCPTDSRVPNSTMAPTAGKKELHWSTDGPSKESSMSCLNKWDQKYQLQKWASLKDGWHHTSGGHEGLWLSQRRRLPLFCSHMKQTVQNDDKRHFWTKQKTGFCHVWWTEYLSVHVRGRNRTKQAIKALQICTNPHDGNNKWFIEHRGGGEGRGSEHDGGAEMMPGRQHLGKNVYQDERAVFLSIILPRRINVNAGKNVSEWSLFC